MKKVIINPVKVVTVGGGSGGFVVDRGLAHDESVQLVSVATSFDSGGSAGRLRDEFGVLPQGDLRRRILAHDTSNNDILRNIFTYRFESSGGLNEQSLGNMILVAASKIWGEKTGLQNVCRLFNIHGKVFPVTYTKTDLCAELSDGSFILGEKALDLRPRTDERSIKKIFLNEKASIAEEVAKEIHTADFLVFCPGDLYTSVLPNLLVDGFSATVKNNKKLKIILVLNIMTKFSETRGYTALDFVEKIEKYLNRKLDYVIYNEAKIPKTILEKYKKEEKSEMVKVNPAYIQKRKDIHFIAADVLGAAGISEGIVRHDSDKLLTVFKKIFEPKLCIWDLDDTLINTSKSFKNTEMDWKVLKAYREACAYIADTPYHHHILLTYAKHGKAWQERKIKHCNLDGLFKEIIITDKLGGSYSKKSIIKKLIQKYTIKTEHTVIIGDSLEGELRAGSELGTCLICVEITQKDTSQKSDTNKNIEYYIKKESDFKKLKEIIG